MANLLLIETSMRYCSVAFSSNGEIVFSEENTEGMVHAKVLSPFVQMAIDVARERKDKIDAVAVSGGPGSYTGLRIGVSTAKGLAYGCGVPLIAVPTLELMAFTARKQIVEKDALLCPMVDARRMEVYTSLYDMMLREVERSSAKIIDTESYGEALKERKVYFFGNGADKCKAVISSENAEFIDGIEPVAANMMELAEGRLNEGKTENVAYYEPFYLKEFVATVPKHKVI